jgi:hypothetical protein
VTEWGSFGGFERLPCPERPEELLGAPIGQYHCPWCGEMQVAGIPHLAPEPTYEEEYGRLWPPGYAGSPDETDHPAALVTLLASLMLERTTRHA